MRLLLSPISKIEPKKDKRWRKNDDPPESDDTDDEESGESQTKTPAAARAPSKGTYPKPKNFAERMMNVLENQVDPKVIDWHGNGDWVVVNVSAIKSSDILETRFQGIRYPAFIRNLSRWYVILHLLIVDLC